MFVMGHFPHLSNLIVQARDDDAQKTGNFIADTIESNVGWKFCFPDVVPDKDRGWSQNGYNIKRADIPYDEWTQVISMDHKRDPSLMCASVQAGSIGMHPTGVLLIDDAHDSKNTESLAEMAKVINAVKADIIPTMTQADHKPMLIVAYTPWKSDDLYAVLEKSGVYRQLVTPAYYPLDPAEYNPANPYHAKYRWERKNKDGEKISGDYVRLTCPSVYNPVTMDQQRAVLGPREFHRQLLLELDYGEGESLPFFAYAIMGNEHTFPMIGGGDPTGSEPDRIHNMKKRSHFALAYVAKLPQGGALVYDGILEQCGPVEAENYILAAQTMFPNWGRCMIEAVGTGAGFYQSATRNLSLRIVATDLYEVDEKNRNIIRSKNDRILTMAKWFEDGTIKIAARRSPFLDALRYLFEHFWELNPNTPHPAWDAGDAVYAALKGMPEILVVKKILTAIPVHGSQSQAGLSSPWASLGRK
jgi:hypothetical protein